MADKENFVGQILKKAREEKRFTQREIGELTNKAPQTVASWESGKSEPDIRSFVNICYKLDIMDIFRTFLTKDSPVFQFESYENAFDYGVTEINKEEKELVLNYRELDNASKDMIQRVVAAVAYANKHSKTKSEDK